MIENSFIGFDHKSTSVVMITEAVNGGTDGSDVSGSIPRCMIHDTSNATPSPVTASACLLQVCERRYGQFRTANKQLQGSLLVDRA